MKIKVLLFGILADKARTRTVVVDNVANLADLKARLENIYPFLKTVKYLTAVNQQINRDNRNNAGNTKLNDNDEIALMPPFAGG